MRMLAKFTLGSLLVSTLLSVIGCGYHNDKEKYYLVAVNIQLPYWQAAASGIRRAAHDMQIQSQFAGPDSYDAQAEVQLFRQAVAAKPAGKRRVFCLLGPIFNRQLFQSSKDPIFGDEYGLRRKCMGSNHEIEIAHRLSRSFQGRAHIGVLLCGF